MKRFCITYIHARGFPERAYVSATDLSSVISRIATEGFFISSDFRTVCFDQCAATPNWIAPAAILSVAEYKAR